ncbi:MAG: serine/threonine-protein kinase PknK [Cyanobacteria bacterium P01_F01_bin.53]
MAGFADSPASGNVQFPFQFPFQLAGYRCDELIYQGATTAVSRGIETASQQRVVLKVLTQEYPSFEEIVRFRNQYAIAQNLPIEGIIRPLKLLPCGNGYGLVMEDFAGQSLAQYAQRQPLGVVAVLEIAIQLAEILHGLHQHCVIHKDIKPGNILIHSASGQVKLGDFSIASRLPKETQSLQSPSRLEGTLAYLAPEQTGRMNRAIDYRTDFYGLGVTLYELLTGQLPFLSTDPLALIHSHIAQRPPAVDQVNVAIPAMVSQVVAKLMAKNAENRYQSALGLKCDLETCLAQWESQGAIAEFELGTRDVGDRFVISEKLYGREVAIHTLLAAFERVAQGQTELMLVAGESGIGKTAVVNEVHKPITRQQGYFIKGKFDQFNRDVPFSAFVQALRSLINQLLGEGDAALDLWRSQIMAAVGENGQVLIDVMPELVHIIGPQPIVPDLPSEAAQIRFHRLFCQFIQLFTTPAHPLVIFLDDLQWADSASLDLLKVLIGETAAGYLLLVGAYRDNEVFPAHPLMLTVDLIHQQGIPLNTLTLRPLTQLDIYQLVTDTLSCEWLLVTPLSDLVYQKNKGNPFFTTQFLQGLYDDGEITFDPDAGLWQCDLNSIRQLVLLDDVVPFLSARLRKLPQETQAVLRVAACLGNRFDLETLSVLCERSLDMIAQDLWQSLQVGLVSPESQTYKFFMGDEPPQAVTKSVTLRYRFLHDRVQQAAYALIADEDKPAHHLRIGQMLLGHRLLANRDEPSDKNDLFQALNNLNKGIALIEDSEQRLQLASLNLEAGQSAKVAMAYAEAVTYFEQGLALLLPDGWESQYSLVVALYSELASVQFLRGEFGAVQAVSDSTTGHVREYADALPIYIAQISSELSQGNMAVGFELGRKVLDSLGVYIPAESGDAQIPQRLSHIRTEFKGKTLEDFLAPGPSEDAQFLGTQELLTLMLGFVYKVKPDLFPLVICEQVSLSLRYGNTPASASIYAAYGMLLCGSHDFKVGFWAAEVALAIREAFPEKQFEMRVRNFIYSYIMPWKQLLRDSLTPLKQGFNLGWEVGDLEYTAYGVNHYVQFLYFSGGHLGTLNKQLSDFAE